MIKRARTILWLAAFTAVAGCAVGGCQEQTITGGVTAADARANEDQAPVDQAPVNQAPVDDGPAGCGPRQHACGTACFSDDDPTSCGTCNHDCTLLPNVVPGSVLCRAGKCVVPAGGCLAGHAHCTGDPADICETDLTTADNCGTCGQRCDASAPFCSKVNGAQACVLRCEGAAPDKCGTSCIDLKTDVNNCGACGKVCNLLNTIAACVGGRCVPSGCRDGYADCSDDPGCETRLGTNAHCGQCNDACGGNRRCDVAARTCVDICAGGGTGNAGHCCSARDCPADRPFCDNHICLARPNGQSCLGAAECATGHCVDGVCCDKACDGQCEACDTSGTIGTCKPVSGMPHQSATPQRPSCEGDPSCGGTCDGTVTDKCVFQRNQCRAASCSSGGVLTSRALCDADGSCPAISTQTCPFACLAATDMCGGTCKPGTKQCSGATPQSCDADGVWQSGTPCAGATPKCDPASHLCVPIAQGEACTGNNQCKTGHCVGGVCCDSPCDGVCDLGTCGGGTCQHKPVRTQCGKREGPQPGRNDVVQYCDSQGKCVFPKVPCGAAQAECDLTNNACCQSEPSTQESLTVSCVQPAQCCDGVSTCNGAVDQRWYGCKSSEHCPLGLICCIDVKYYMNFGTHYGLCRTTCSGSDTDFNRELCDLDLPASQCVTGGVCHSTLAVDYSLCY